VEGPFHRFYLNEQAKNVDATPNDALKLWKARVEDPANGAKEIKGLTVCKIYAGSILRELLADKSDDEGPPPLARSGDSPRRGSGGGSGSGDLPLGGSGGGSGVVGEWEQAVEDALALIPGTTKGQNFQTTERFTGKRLKTQPSHIVEDLD
jgi:hypothetical protein